MHAHLNLACSHLSTLNHSHSVVECEVVPPEGSDSVAAYLAGCLK